MKSAVWLMTAFFVLLAAMGRTAAVRADQADAKSKPAAAKPAPDQAGVKKDAPAEKKATDPKRFEPFGYVQHEHEIAISGRATNEEGDPVAGARIFVAANPLEKQPLAEGKTDAEGRYQFKVRLPVNEYRPEPVPKPTEGQFQAFGVAEGYGLAWRRTRTFRPERRPKEGADPKSEPLPPGAANDLKYVFFEGEPIVIELEFSPEVRLHGRITDDRGNPLPDAVVQIGLVNTDRDQPGAPPRSWLFTYSRDSSRAADQQFNGLFSLPEEFRSAKTNADGRYEIRGVPRDCYMLAFIDYRPEYDAWGGSLATIEKGDADGSQVVGRAGELNHVFAVPGKVDVHVHDPARKPVAGALVRLEAERGGIRRARGGIRRAGALARTDAGGLATLHLPPGDHTLAIEPAIGQPWLPQRLPLEITSERRDRAVDIALAPAAEVVFEAVEKETGKPIPGATFLSETIEGRERPQVESHVSFIDHPQTDNGGRLSAFFEPGERRFFVRPTGDFEPLSPITDFLDLTPGKATRLRFEFARRAPARDEAGQERKLVSEEVKPLRALLEKQAERFARSQQMRIRVRRHNHLRAPLGREKFTELLESFSAKTVDECLAALKKEFPDFTIDWSMEFITDGKRLRVESRSPDRTSEFNLFNGEELVVSMDAGRQLDIHDRESSVVHIGHPRDFWSGPAPPDSLTPPRKSFRGDELYSSARHESGRWQIDLTSKDYVYRRTIDETTGLELLNSYTHLPSKNGSETWQFFPKLLPNGLAVPKLSIRCLYQADGLQHAEVTVIDEVELLERIAPETFLAAAPAGTHVLDYRGLSREQRNAGRQASSTVLNAAVPDVVAHWNHLAPHSEPVLKAGDTIPELQIAKWLNADGETARPALAGKILVLEFWGLRCGPSAAQLDEVNDAAKKLAGTRVVIVGIHDAGGQAERVVEFAKNSGLVFPMALDKPADKRGSSGLTFSAFGIDVAPMTAVIDGTGQVAYIGHFTQALEVARQLLQGK
jgi:protocatechuate 3,4-dioxygenase beta subunit